jgi:hypothetical protein
MTADEQPPADQQTGSDLLPEGSDADPLLALLVSIIRSLPEGPDGESSSIGVSLSVGGQLWTGQLVSARGWSARISDALRAATNPELGAAFAQLFDRFKEAHEAPPAELGEAPLAKTPIGYVHLLEAFPVVIGRNVEGGGLAMRFRLSEVSGWTLGNLTFA